MVIIRHGPATGVMWLARLLLAVLAVLAGAGCTRAPEVPLRVGTHVWPGFEPLYLARQQGYYPSGSVRLVEYSSGSDAIQAFRAGAIDAEALTLDEALLLAETTPDLSVVLVLDVSNGGDVILAQPARSSLRDLKGRRVGLEAGALGAYVLTRALQTVDLTPKDVVVVSLDSFEHERAFKEGRVDAVVTYEPTRTRLLAAGARTLFDSSQIPGEIVDVLVVRRSFAAKHGERVDELVRGWFRALDFIRADSRQAASLMARREQLGADEFQKSLEGLRFYGIEENRSMLAGPAPAIIPTARQLSRVMIDNQLLKRAPEARELIDGRFVERAARP